MKTISRAAISILPPDMPEHSRARKPRRANYVSYEGTKPWPTTGKGKYKHPIQEAAAAEKRLRDEAEPQFDEFLVLPFIATNSPPFKFSWVDHKKTLLDYGAILARVSNNF